MYCKNCGQKIDDKAAICIHCGVATREPAHQTQQPVVNVVNNNVNNNGFYYKRKNKWIAFFLCLFFGELGFHRFYVGKIGTGILWMFTLGLFGFGWLIDLIVILIGGFKDSAGQPVS